MRAPRIAPLFALLLAGAAAGGCTAAGFCCGRLTDFDETTGSDRRKVKKEIREEREERLEDAADELFEEAEERREGDLEDYYAWLAGRLDLAKTWTASRARPGFVRAWRITTHDGVFGDGGGFAGARLLAIPDWSYLVTAALEAKFDREFSKAKRDRLARDLWLGERWAIRHLDAGIAGIDIAFTLESTELPPGFETVRAELGTARTDLEGRAGLTLDPEDVPGGAPPVAYELLATAVSAPPGSPAIERDEAGHLFVRRGRGTGVVLVDAEDVLDWTRAVSVRAMIERERFTARDWCAKEALPVIARAHGLAAVSSQPDALASVFRRGLASSGATGEHPRSFAMHFAPSRTRVRGLDERLARFTGVADRYAAALGDGGVAGLVTSDAALADAFAKATGLRAWTLAAPSDGGWCAGLPSLVPPRK